MKTKLLQIWPIIAMIILSLTVGWQLLRKGYFPMHDDLQVMRFYQMRRCFDDGQLPCRWSPNMGNEYGQPMFNYYSAFPYYLGTAFNLLGASYINTVKIVFLLSLFFSALFAYLFARQFFSRPASLLASAAYLIAPYHALDIFVRGALAESWGLVFMPAMFYSITRVIKSPSIKTGLILTLTTAGLLTTHNLTVLMVAPFLLIYTLLLFRLHEFTLPKLKYLVLGGLIGVGLSSFFLLPVLFEQNLTQGGKYLTADYFNFRAHFTTLRQLLLNTSWAYGPSKFGPDDDISFFVGFIQLFGLLASPFVLFRTFFKNKNVFTITLFFVGLTFLALFMTHGKSDPIWTIIPKLAFVQFPWRFLGLVIFGSAFLLGALLNQIKSSLQLPLLAIGIISLVVLNFRYFSFEKWFYWITDEQKLSGELYNLQVRAAVLDYLPNSAQKIPETKALPDPQIITGTAFINYFDRRTAYFATEIDVKEPSSIAFPVTYFPNWTVYLNRATTPYPFSYDNDYGQITIDLPQGHHLVQAFFDNTPLRTLANTITLISAVTLLTWVGVEYAKKTT
ncbi:MAG: hypothetical protein ACD_40C00332G0005 [uncultured bacterium]|nr:MAG: hypothetical protein ACD_40C00332G0005 [uncultured bacterium]